MAVSAADTTSKTEAASAAAAASPAIAPTSSAPAKPAGASTPHTDHALHGRALALVFFGLLLAMFISSLSETIASTALPTIVGDLNGVEIMQWVSTAYILSSTLVMPIYGKLGDLIGRKRLLMAALTLYAAGKVVCGLAMNMEMLISGRLVSGLGGGGLIILSQATLSDVVPPRKLGTYMGVIGAVFAVSNVLGPLMGGWFVQVTGWRWIFWFTVPVALLAVVVLGLDVAPRRPCPRKAPSRLARHDGHDRGRDLARAGHGLGRHAYSLGQSAVYGPCRSGCGCRCGLRAVGAPRRRAHHPHGALPQPQLRAVLGNGASPEHQLHGSAQLPAHRTSKSWTICRRRWPVSCARLPAWASLSLPQPPAGWRRRRGATRGCSWPCAS